MATQVGAAPTVLPRASARPTERIAAHEPWLRTYVAVVEIALGIELLAFPVMFAGPIFAPIHAFLAPLGVASLASGAIVGISRARGPIRRGEGVALLAAVGPLVVMAVTLVGSGVVTGVGWLVFATALVVLAAMIQRGHQPTDRLFLFTAAAHQALLGIAMVLSADALRQPAIYASLGSYLWLYVPSTIAAAALIAAGLLRGRRLQTNAGVVLAAFNLGSLALVFASTQVWTGVFNFAALAVMLIATLPTDRTDRWAVAFGWLAMGLAAWSLAAWLLPSLGVAALRPDWTVMRPHAAAALLAECVALLLIANGDERRRPIAGGFGLLGFAIAAAHAVVAIQAGETAPEPATLMGEQTTAVGVGPDLFLLFGGAFLVARAYRPDARWPAHFGVTIGIAAVSFAILNVLVYVGSATAVLGAVPGFGIRLLGAIGFFAFSTGVVLDSFAVLARGRVRERVFVSLATLMIAAMLVWTVGDRMLHYGIGHADPTTREQLLWASDVLGATGLLVLVGASIVLGAVVSRTITAPLAALGGTIERVRGGDFTARVTVTQDDEIGAVSSALNRMASQLEIVSENAPLILWVWDSAGVYQMIAGSGMATLGLERDMVLGHPATEVWPWRSDPRTILARGLAGEFGSQVAEIGGTSWDCRWAPARDASGSVVGVLGLAIDVTELRRATGDLASARAKLEDQQYYTRSLIEASLDALATIDVDGRIADVNREMELLAGRPREELIHTPMALYFVEPERIADGIARVFRDGQVRDFEVTGLSKDGHRTVVSFNATTYADRQGKVLGIFAAARDITALKQAERAVRTSEERYRGLVESQSELVVRLDRDGRFTYANDAYRRTFNAARDDVIGTRAWEALVDPADLAVARAGLETIRLGADRHTVEFRMRGAQGYRWIDWEIAAVRDAAGALVEIQAVGRDVQDRKIAEQALAELNATLEAKVVARTAELVAANTELEAFAYSVSHDLRAPLRAIAGFTGSVLTDFGPTLEPRAKSDLERVSAAASRMAGLIDDLLTLSRTTRRELKPRPVDVSAIAAQVVDEFRAADPARAVTVSIQPGMTAVADPDLLRVALENLVGNAWKFTRPKPKTRIAIGACVRDGDIAYFVRDNGVGFDQAYADRLFTAFQRLHGAEFEGSGVGLATVRRVIARHGGRTWAEGKTGEGATFYFTLRAEERADEREAAHGEYRNDPAR